MDEKTAAHLSYIARLPIQEREAAAAPLGYRIESQDEDRALFKNESGHAVMAFRGTDLEHRNRRWRDVMADAAVLVGKAQKSPRYMASERAYADAVRQHGRVDVVGHSLGGHQALHLAREYGARATVFNPATSIPDVARGVRDWIVGRRAPDATSYITHRDPISIATMARLAGKVVVRPVKPGESAHALKNFL